MKKIISLFLIVLIVCATSLQISANSEIKSGAEIEIPHNAFSVYLCEAKTGKVLYANNEFSPSAPASVTKVMTLLLVMEAYESGAFSLNDKVRISAKAASMGGSQVFLEEGESVTVEELIKSAVIASGNDASVALAELVAGSESAFVKLMNERASELGLKSTHFENTTGLDDTVTNHYSCAADIAKMSRELIKHELILKYSSIWQDTIRNGKFTLTNTNRLVRYYDGCNGLKTGSTDKAGFCISATAKRGNMQLIAVVMGAESSDKRNAIARELLDYGFANYTLYEMHEQLLEQAKVLGGMADRINLYAVGFSDIIDKRNSAKVEMIYEIPEALSAPVNEGDKVGRIVFKINGEQIGDCDIVVHDSVSKIGYLEFLSRILKRLVSG